MWFRSAPNSATGAANQRRSVPSILAAGLRVDGDIACDGEVHIVGTLQGNLTADKLTLGEGGAINGTVEAATAVINGSLSGRLAAVTVILGRTAQVTADIIYVSMRIEPGAIFEGYSRRVERVEMATSDSVQLPSPRGAVEQHGNPGTPAPGND